MDTEDVITENKHMNDKDDVPALSCNISNLLNTICFEEIDNTHCFSLNSPECYVCNGYYGSCYGDPTCDTCHAFLYPNAGPDTQQILTILQNSDDSDSGNDEPVEAEQAFKVPHYMYGVENEQEIAREQIIDISMHEFFENDEIECIPNRQLLFQQQQHQRHESPQPLVSYQSHVNIDELPPEVLMNVFEYLDELSLWAVGQVSQRWKTIIKKLVRSENWKDFIYARWPLLYVTHEDQDFYDMYTAVMESCNCLKCLKQMIAQEQFDVEDNSWRKHRLRTELRAMRLDPLEGIYALPLDPLCCHWQASIQGPIGSPYEGGLFFLYIQIPHTYPMGPPIVRFLTKILHPNISRHGDVGIDSIHHNWSLALTISKVLISIQSLLTDPYCDICMEPAVGALYMDNRPCFEEQARLWTWKYAMHGLRRH